MLTDLFESIDQIILKKYMRHRVSPDDADDLITKVDEKVWNNIGKITGSENALRNYVLAVASSVVSDHFRGVYVPTKSREGQSVDFFLKRQYRRENGPAPVRRLVAIEPRNTVAVDSVQEHQEYTSDEKRREEQVDSIVERLARETDPRDERLPQILKAIVRELRKDPVPRYTRIGRLLRSSGLVSGVDRTMLNLVTRYIDLLRSCGELRRELETSVPPSTEPYLAYSNSSDEVVDPRDRGGDVWQCMTETVI